MVFSVHTNEGALTALQHLNQTDVALRETQTRIATGLAIQTAKDNAAVWAIAQGQRADIGSLGAVKMSLDRATSIADIASQAGGTISDLLVEIKGKVVAAMDPSLDTNSRKSLDSDFKSLLRQISQVVQSAAFDGANLLNGSVPQIRFIASADASSFITLSGQNLSLGGPIVTIPSTASLSTVTFATALLAQVTASIASANGALGVLGSQSKQFAGHSVFIRQLTDQLSAGVGNLVDADLAVESARLQAQQVQQQLGVQSLSIANHAPEVLLQLFKNA